PDFLTCSALLPTMLAQIKTMVRTETNGAAGSTVWTSRGVRWCSASPTISGTSTTCTVLRKSPHAGTGTIVPASHLVSSGVITIAPKVEHMVIRTDNATLARAM